MRLTAESIIFALLALVPLASCEREADTAEPLRPGEMAITAGFEQPCAAGQTSRSGQDDPTADTKTYVADGVRIRWSARAVDKVIYVFDSAGNKNAFTCSATSASDTRTFTGTVTEGSQPTLVLWSGKRATDDRSTLTISDGDPAIGAGTEPIGGGGTIEFKTKADVHLTHPVLSGPSLAVVNPQNIEFSNSFATDANIAIMRPGDDKLISVFGFLRYKVPAGVDGSAAIKSITISADEDVAGQVEIDCAAEPVAKIVADGSKSLTVLTPWITNDNYYEPGTFYAVLPAGAYNNMTITITPFAGSARTQDAETGTPFTIHCKETVYIQRGCYSDIGTLPSAKPLSPGEGFLFGDDWFSRFVDPKTGVISYRIKSEAIGWDNSQSCYFVTKAMTDDERFIYFTVSGNEFRPAYHYPEQSAKIIDLQTRKIYTFPKPSGYAYLDPVEDKLYYCVMSADRASAKFYRRDLLFDPGADIPLADYPRSIVPTGVNKPIKRTLSHITLTTDKQKVFIDAWIKPDTFYQGLLNLYTGEWEEWAHNDNQLHLTHGQMNPVRDDEALLAVDYWTDQQGVFHSMDEVGHLDDGEFGGEGTYRRINIMKPDGSIRTIRPSDFNYASHEGWCEDGDHVYFVSGGRLDNGTYTGGFWIRNVRTDELEVGYTPRATHCNPTADRIYVTFDDDRPFSPYTEGYYRGSPWRVWFYNRLTGKYIAIYSGLPPITTPEEPSQLHPDPHPHFVANGKYIVCTAAGDDGNLHFSITPVDQLIALTQ